MKDKLKNYSFWISVTGAVLLLLNNLGKIFGFSVNNEAVYSIVDGVCGVLVVFGILTMNKSNKTTDTTQNLEEDATSTDASTTNADTSATDDAASNDKTKSKIDNTESSTKQ